MALWKITAKRSVYFSGVQLEEGMSVQISDRIHGRNNMLCTVTNDKSINDAFMRIYDIDLAKAGLLNDNYLDIKLISDGYEGNEKKSGGGLLSTLFQMLTS